MPLALKLILRFLRSPRRSLVRFTAVVAVIGIAAGVASLIVAQALGRGFREEIQTNLLANAPHISIFRPDAGYIDNAEMIAAAVAKLPNVDSVMLTRTEQVLLSGPNSMEYAVIDVGGREGDGDGGESIPLIYVGAELAARTGVANGSVAEIVRFNDAAERVPVNVGGTFETGLFDLDSTRINISRRDYLRLTGDAEFTPSVIAVSLKDVFHSERTAAEIREKLGTELRVMDWREANRPLFGAMALERKAAFAVILLIIFIAVLNITTTLALLVNERRLDIAVLRTCGARIRTIIVMFLFEGILVGLLGTATGVLVGLLACVAANYFRLVSLSGEVYLVDYVPLRTSTFDVLLIAAAVLVLCLLASIYPAFRAGRIKPAENLRNS